MAHAGSDSSVDHAIGEGFSVVILQIAVSSFPE